MKFEGRPLSARAHVVNAGLAAAVLFTVAACSGGDTAPEQEPESPTAALSEIVELPAVWSTSALDKPVSDIALAGGLSPALAIAYEGSGVQFFNLEAERVAETAPYTVTRLASGVQASVAGADLTIFPGINRDNRLMAYVFGDGLVAPVEVDLNIGADVQAAGMCAGSPNSSDDGLFQLGYWTKASDTFIHSGHISEENGEFTWIPNGPALGVEAPITTCTVTEKGVETSSSDFADTALLSRNGYEALITLTPSGAISALQSNGALQRVLIEDGISVKMPETPVAIAALGKPLVGGYGGGLIIAAGDVDGESKAVFIAADNLTGMSACDQ